jgi:hypothetical protein
MRLTNFFETGQDFVYDPLNVMQKQWIGTVQTDVLVLFVCTLGHFAG